MICRTEAVVLKAMPFRDSSLIVTLFTRDFGKFSALAKGARGPKSRMASSLMPMCIVEAVFYRKESRDLQLLTQCDVSQPLKLLGADIGKIATGMAVVELTDRVTRGTEESRSLFGHVVGTLAAIDTATKNTRNALYFFELRLLDVLGFRCDYGRCPQCGIPLDTDLTNGMLLEVMAGILCPACAERGVGFRQTSPAALRALQYFQNVKEVQGALNLSMSVALEEEVAGLLRRALQRHVEGLDHLKSEEVFAAILPN
jgi:DNA repair protein RecO (recombination protein O)